MHAIAEIDKAGRVIVPKKMRDALHLVPGTRLSLEQEGEAILIKPERPPRGLYRDRGWLVYDAGPLPPVDAAEWVRQDREERIAALSREPEAK